MDDKGALVGEVRLAPPLFAHQRAAIDFACAKKSPESKNGGIGCAALFHDPGCGKTRAAIEIYKALKAQHPRRLVMLVIAPISLHEAAWHVDLGRYAPELSFRNAHRDGLSATLPDVVTINYEYFQRDQNVKAFITHLRKLWKDTDLLAVLDESSKIKNHASLTTKNILSLKNFFDYRLVMTGTPAPNSKTEYFAQIDFVAPGLFGTSFAKFRNTYFHLQRNGQAINTQGMILSRAAMADLFKKGASYSITQERADKLFDVMAPWVHVAEKDKCLDLPERVDEIRMVALEPAQRRAYKSMKTQLVADIAEKKVVAMVALAKIIKLREITSGFAVSDDGAEVEFETSPKLKALDEILDELGDRPAIIWCQFTWEIRKVVALLEERARIDATSWAFKTETLYGGTKDKDGAIQRFINGEARYLVANPHSAAHGLTFVNASHQVFFSLDYSWEAYQQARDRTHRPGQKKTCIYYHILAEDTIDVDILEVLREKKSAQALIYRLTATKEIIS